MRPTLDSYDCPGDRPELVGSGLASTEPWFSETRYAADRKGADLSRRFAGRPTRGCECELPNPIKRREWVLLVLGGELNRRGYLELECVNPRVGMPPEVGE